jgi:hypothetical protein
MSLLPEKSLTKANFRPLPLKQRTSSVDQRRDYSTQTWTSLLGLLKVREFLVTVDHFSIWRRHLAWAFENGKDLRDYMTQRYASSMVFMSLLLSTELNVLFNSAGVTTQVRHALMTENLTSVSFWAGIAIIMSAVLTLLSLISTFTAWTMVSAVSENNAHCIFRSSIGQYAAELPGRFIVGSIYSFLVWLILFFFLLLPFGVWSIGLLLISLALFVHTITAFSAFGRVIMHTGAMGSQRIFDPSFEVNLHPHGLHNNLLVKAKANLTNCTSIMRQYRSKVKPINRQYSEDELSSHLSDRFSGALIPEAGPARKRTGSLVKFADGYDTNGDFCRKPLDPTLGLKKLSGAGQNRSPLSAVSERSSSPPNHPADLSLESVRALLPAASPRPSLVSRRESRDGVDMASPFEGLSPRNLSEDDNFSGVFERWLSSSNQSATSESFVSAGADVTSPRIGSGDAKPGKDALTDLRIPTFDEFNNHSALPGSIAASHSNSDQRDAIRRSFSAVSSLDDDDAAVLAEDERFEHEYGDLFEPERANFSYDFSIDGNSNSATPPLSVADPTSRPDSTIGGNEDPERTALLSETDRLERGDYDSCG